MLFFYTFLSKYNLTFQSEGEDELKKRQLMELAIINGTYRDSQSKNSSRKSKNENPHHERRALIFVYFLFTAGLEAQRFLVANSQAALQTMMNQQNAALRTAAPLGGAPLIISPRLQVPTSLASGLLNGTGGQNPAGPPPRTHNWQQQHCTNAPPEKSFKAHALRHNSQRGHNRLHGKCMHEPFPTG